MTGEGFSSPEVVVLGRPLKSFPLMPDSLSRGVSGILVTGDLLSARLGPGLRPRSLGLTS